MVGAVGQIPAQAVLPVLVVDLGALNCCEASASGFSATGCRIFSSKLDELSDLVGLRLDGFDKMVKGQIVNRADNEAEVNFVLEDDSSGEKRKEKRQKVSIPARVTDRKGRSGINCTIVDASRSGCRVDSEMIDGLPEKILIRVAALDLPVPGEIVWRTQNQAGVRLIWQFSNRDDFRTSSEKVRAKQKVRKGL